MSRPSVARPLALTGLTTAPPQAFGALRLVPLLRERPAEDLRLGLRRQPPAAVTAVELDARGTVYASYVPHAMIARWSDDGTAVGTLGGQLLDARRSSSFDGFPVRVEHRMAKREEDDVLRFLPLHLAMEYLLALCFGGPDVRWPEWSRRALRDGLSPRVESAVPGWAIRGLDDALRMFEIHAGQVGLALFAADALASLFVAPHPDDYRRMHRSLIRDFFGELVWTYARVHDDVGDLRPEPLFAAARDLGDLRVALGEVRAGWAGSARLLLDDVLGRPVHGERVQRMGSMALERFFTALSPGEDAHLGEAITRADGEVLYLKTLRLSRAQTKRAYLLQQLASHDWNLDQAAVALGTGRPELIRRLVRAELGWMLNPRVLQEVRSPPR